MFSLEIQKKLKKEGYDLICEEENIWVKEIGDQSITISGKENLIEAIWQTFEGEFEEISSNRISEVIDWSNGKLRA